ncbi:16S rRNA (cytosine(1402)-N(4))-methyltransferase RsmH [thiotrophic endosymbiont of Bathymodiolus puteoserpentis (Logatchev)]|jgi:16S rRNA (cytosine1402-N4)-methyltransferase|uniref:16S rRNA (cytosine(1402)-N(4))-methyltransferase RsmH n=1 Tax=thiotrophic endosymbiont of Bathymodiolus puteoserpentis (Logatchev) TaxID=343240 RepID=UPI0010B5D340|nr:16S rRNA (cytosine(1402)-N(4))-methyltransferase RsmH [thiotrophic endosymbiont of Bathymodiolus puteoserpentis (Logatchev)]CAC9579490.1 16S rRNA (cytosine(1402)-N(4))-methyltransferase (EC 2.1.1.199) [uncultured Gammaproteobacteria bacterium]CAC9585210.1 16S rRNA (cytosine(1402)-N(4))-methyltransferase (EC 2.1.1.199) [uncultured Gammaproteobacteria bacterium]CAC9629232.1 16S rRNA (cytosine(1402)-N(4))-methyltransferase (EC 2.1.1.199) [uncultured Gammaproteobacteria bacterium]CAC9629610.1 16
MSSHHHQSVMFDESIIGLKLKSNGVYIDATFGRGGHALGILEKLGDQGKLIAFDQDITAIEYANQQFNDSRLRLIHSPFVNMHQILSEEELLGKIDGIFMDLGVSSPQLDNAERGFSFNTEGPLDMRMNQSSGISVAQWLVSADEVEIANVIYEFGEERKSRHIASAIKRFQQEQPIKTTLQLANIVASVVKTKKNKHPATRTFQAMRIFINQELTQLSETLKQTINLLAPEGRLCVISFHSIEDRIVKQFIQQHSKQKQLPKGLPIMDSDVEQTLLQDLGKSFASKEELNNNKRSRSAILRIAQRTTKDVE